MKHYIYILECLNGTLYTGYTLDMQRRYQEHLSGSPKCKYTRSFPPRKIASCWQINASLSTVLKIEHAIKQLMKRDKLELIRDPETLTDIIRQPELKKDITIIQDLAFLQEAPVC